MQLLYQLCDCMGMALKNSYFFNAIPILSCILSITVTGFSTSSKYMTLFLVLLSVDCLSTHQKGLR